MLVFLEGSVLDTWHEHPACDAWEDSTNEELVEAINKKGKDK
jgi:Na+-translocating ferredoxin:NAD+ oxidoreductase RnfC subunit